MPCRYAGLLAGGDVNKQTWVSHIQFEISLLVSSGGVISGWWSHWNGLHTADWVVIKPGLLGLSA